ncbi:MAG: methyltransferase family protein [Promethearchaeota archaeon]
MLPLHFMSVEHRKFEEKYGKEQSIKITKYLGLISGWGFFIFWFGVWISPQPRFNIPLFQNLAITIPIFNFTIPFLHLIISIPFIIIGAWLAIQGVRGTTLKVSETHRAEKIITTGIYAKIRHPQYFGGILVHVGITFLLSAFFSLISTPLIIFYNYLTSWKEERELIKEFGNEYRDYMEKIPMFIPKFKRNKNIRKK